MDLDVWGTLSFRRLAHFVAVVEAGTISGAAERLFMSQSAVAGSVTELERALEADLFIRRRGRGRVAHADRRGGAQPGAVCCSRAPPSSTTSRTGRGPSSPGPSRSGAS